jgi:hypothetical protein
MESKRNDQEAERLSILKMVEEGKLSAGEAASLLSAMNQEEGANPVEFSMEGSDTSSSPEAIPEPMPSVNIQTTGNGPRWFRVRVTNLASGRTKATVNLPIGLVNLGMKIGARYAPEVSELDFAELSQLIAAEAEGKIVDVVDEEDGEHVEIFLD